MKLYAKISSDEGGKIAGKGSNKELTIELFNGNESVGRIIFDNNIINIMVTDEKNHHLKEWKYRKDKKQKAICFTEECEEAVERGIYCERHAQMYEEETGETIKGEKQKGNSEN